MSLSQRKTAYPNKDPQSKRVAEDIILWLNQAQYDRLFELIQHRFSSRIPLVMDDILPQFVARFNEIREEFIYSVECVMKCDLKNRKTVDCHLKDLNKLRSLIHIFKNLLAALSLKIESAIDNDFSLHDSTLTNYHYKTLDKSCRCFDFFYRYASTVTILFERMASLDLVAQSSEFGLFDCTRLQLLGMWEQLHKSNSRNQSKTLHIECLVDRMNRELARLEYTGQSRNTQPYFRYPPCSLDDIFKLTLMDTITLDLPKLILVYCMYDLNYLYGSRLFTEQMLPEITQVIGLDASLRLMVEQLWLIDNSLHSSTNDMCVFPFWSGVVLYDDQHLTTLKSFIFDDHVDKALNFADRFPMTSMPLEFNSLVVGLLCNGGMYFRLVPLIKSSNKLPDYWHIIIHYSVHIESLFSYLVNAFFMLDSIDRQFIWQFVDHFISLQYQLKLLHQFCSYRQAYPFVVYICSKMDGMSADEQHNAKSILSDFSVKFRQHLPSLNSWNQTDKTDKSDTGENDSTLTTDLNFNSSKDDCSFGAVVESNSFANQYPTTSRLPVQSINESLGVSMCSSLLNRSSDYQVKNIANRLHYSLNTSFQPTSILKRKSTDSNSQQSPSKESVQAKKLRFIIDGIVLSSGREEKPHNLNETFDISNNQPSSIRFSNSDGDVESSSDSNDEMEFFDAVEFHEPIENFNSAMVVARDANAGAPLVSSPYVDSGHTRFFDSTTIPAIAINTSLFDENSPISICTGMTTEDLSKQLLDTVTANLSDRFENLTPEEETNGSNDSFGSKQAVQANSDLSPNEEEEEEPLNATITLDDEPRAGGVSLTVDNASASGTLPLPAIEESLILADKADITEPGFNEVTTDVDHGVNTRVIRKPTPAVNRRAHRVKHKPVAVHLIEMVAQQGNSSNDDSPYNSVVEKRSFNNSDTSKPSLDSSYFKTSLAVDRPSSAVSQSPRSNNTFDVDLPSPSASRNELVENMAFSRADESQSLNLPYPNADSTVSDVLRPLHEEFLAAIEPSKIDDASAGVESEMKAPTRSGLVTKALPQIPKKSSLKQRRNARRQVANSRRTNARTSDTVDTLNLNGSAEPSIDQLNTSKTLNLRSRSIDVSVPVSPAKRSTRKRSRSAVEAKEELPIAEDAPKSTSSSGKRRTVVAKTKPKKAARALKTKSKTKTRKIDVNNPNSLPTTKTAEENKSSADQTESSVPVRILRSRTIRRK